MSISPDISLMSLSSSLPLFLSSSLSLSLSLFFSFSLCKLSFNKIPHLFNPVLPFPPPPLLQALQNLYQIRFLFQDVPNRFFWKDLKKKKLKHCTIAHDKSLTPQQTLQAGTLLLPSLFTSFLPFFIFFFFFFFFFSL